jgi:ATP-dependent protease ClpP protease subunit
MRVENAATRVDVYDDIGTGMFSDGLTAKDFTDKLGTVTGPLDVHINSYGGSVADGVAIGNAIRAYSGPKRTIVDGMAASIASVIMQAGDERIMQPGAMVMIHDASTMAAGNAADMTKVAADLDKHSDNIAKLYAQRAGGTPAQWREAMRAETWYDAEEAVTAGLADKVGTGAAALPAGLDLAAFTAIPGRIVAHLQRLAPRAAYTPAPYKRESWENVCCPVCGCYNDDDGKYCGQCGVMLAGRDDVTSERTGSGDGMSAHAYTHPHAAANHGPFTGSHSHAHPAFGDQGDDATHEHSHSHDGDADHHHKHADGASNLLQLHIDATLDPDVILAEVRKLVAASIDQSDWDGDKAMSMAANSDDPAATYKQICAGRRDGDPSKQDSWALPYRYPGKGPNANGVRNALSRLPQTQGLTNKADAEALLQRLMKQINPDRDGDADDAAPSWLTQTVPAAPAWLNPAKEAAL